MKPKICICIRAATKEEFEERAERALDLGADLIELRADYLRNPSPRIVEELVTAYAEKAILTIRPEHEGGFFRGSEGERLELLERAAMHKPAYIDVELTTTGVEGLAEKLRGSCALIVSFHNFNGTPNYERLRKIASNALELGDIAKVVTMAKNTSDVLRVLKLYEELPKKKLIAYAMGGAGIISRILSPVLGAPIAYASLPGEETAPNQLTYSELKRFLELVKEA